MRETIHHRPIYSLLKRSDGLPSTGRRGWRCLLLALLSGGLFASPCLGEAAISAARQVFAAGTGELTVSSEGLIVGSEAEDANSVLVDGIGLEVWFERFVGGRTGSVRVPTSYRFCAGDRVELRFRSNQDIHFVSLTRTIEPAEKATEKKPWRLLSGPEPQSRLVASMLTERLPSTGPMVLDFEPQPREILLIAARQAIDLSDFYDAATGALSRVSEESLDSRIDRWSRNLIANRGGDGGNETYGFTQDHSTPLALELHLDHRACERRFSMHDFSSSRRNRR